ncbi:MAG: hypothetical protein VB855_18065 [Pirellulaceae bacterium]
MTLTTENLQKLHRLHQQVTDLRDRMERGPRQLTAKGNELAGVKQVETDLKEQATRKQMEADEKQLAGREREANIEDLRAKLNACSSNEVYASLVKDIESNQEVVSQIDDQILALLEELEELEQKMAKAAGHRDEVSTTLAQLQGEVELSQKQLSEELDRVQGELKETESQLPEDFRQDYNHMAETRGEGALASVENECCSGCHQRITAQMINELYLSKPVFCKSCGCLLYLPEGASLNEDGGS